jgi:glutamyl-tRNA(Gln) amidotransferase subunit E
MEKDGGLKIGLEIHQQLNTGKLFCRCASELDDCVVGEFERGLRAARGEMGEVDGAARHEHDKALRFRYQMTRNSCAVEADEQPPMEANSDAVSVALTVALMLGATPVDEIHFMRKLVVDGSNTAGFQRTALVATGGKLCAGERDIPILTVCLEEDAARRIDQSDGTVTYRLDRLGVPLVEVATGPDIDSPELAREVALAIGRLLRDTGKAMRGIGSIREDLNVSVPGGARVEIKGVQELNSIVLHVTREVSRQKRLASIAEELGRRGAAVRTGAPVDVTHVLKDTESKVVKGALAKGGKVYGITLEKFAGLLRGGDADADRLGSELAQQARAVGLKGLFHTDELPGYGISGAETRALKAALGCGEGDAFVIVAADRPRALLALERVGARARAAFEGVPEETRDPAADGSSTYSRPLPGGARMYPETDVPSIRVTADMLDKLRSLMPKTREERIAILAKEYPSLGRQVVAQLVDEGKAGRFVAAASAGGKASASIAASAILYDPNASAIDGDFEVATFKALAIGAFAKEAVAAIYAEKAGHPGDGLGAIVDRLGLRAVGHDEMRVVVAAVVAENANMVAERGERAAGPLMGEAMKRLRGRADGKLVNEAVRDEIRKLLAQSAP